jgi:hypothetical protein
VIQAPYKDRIEFWKFQHAFITFGEVTLLCEQILKQEIISGHPLHPSMMTALHILYGRPFKQRTEVKLSEEIIPKDYKETHGMLINMRDQIYAHMDVDGPKSTENNSVNKVGVFIKDGQVHFAMTMAFPRETQIEKIRELTKLLTDKTFFHSEKIWQRHFRSKYVPDNNYEVNLSKEDDAFLKPICF